MPKARYSRMLDKMVEAALEEEAKKVRSGIHVTDLVYCLRKAFQRKMKMGRGVLNGLKERSLRKASPLVTIQL